MNDTTKKLAVWALGICVVLAIPMILTYLNPTSHINGGSGGGWDWSWNDLPFGFIVIFGARVVYEFVARKMNNALYKKAVLLSVVTGLVLIWINAAVGIISQDEWPNLLYLGLILFGGMGAIISKFRPIGMSRTLYTMAAVLILIPLIVLVISPSLIMSQPPGIAKVIFFHIFFAELFAASGVLFGRTEGKND